MSAVTASTGGRGHDDDSGDISLSRPPDKRPLAAGPAMPTPRNLQHSGIVRSSSARLDRPPDGDVGERARSTTGYRATASPSPSPTPTPTTTPTPRRQVSESPLSPLHARRMTRSRSLNVRIPSIDLTAKSVQSSTSATYLAPEISAPAPSPRPPPLIDDETASSMARWVKEIVVCNFDLERGPVVERRAGGRRWGPGVKENVAFSSFPDTSLFTEGSIQFSFKIRHVPPDPAALAFPEPPSPNPAAESFSDAVLPEKRDRADEYRKWDERGREWMYGFVWFQQRRDRGIARGYMQKSVVILTHLPFPALWSAVLSHLAPAFFAHGYTALEVACRAIATWPDPVPDARLDLPLLSEVLPVKLPDATDNPQVGWGCDPILASHPPSSPLRAFASFLPHLWSIWECLVLAEPVLVIASDPRTCSEIVWWLRELLRPIPLAGDFRPYLHIHDHDFSLLVNSNKPQAGVLVGVTNPFFRNAASHWPNVIAVPFKGEQRAQRVINPEGFISKRQRSVQKDRALLKQLEILVAAGKLDDKTGNMALRTHFQQLTERFLVPLNRYFQTLVPPPTSGSSTPHRPSLSRGSSFTSGGVLPPPPAMSLSGLKPFSLPSFLAHLKKHGPNPLSFKSKGLAGKARVENDFYAAFCMGACFAGWLAARVQSLGLALAPMGNEGLLTASGFSSARDSGDASSARGSGDASSARVSGDTSGTSGTSATSGISTSASASERSSVDDPGATPRAIEPFLPLVGDENAARRLGRLGIAD
ncbi:hypothetical protein CcaverHIS002_0306230 [Cutaneotrichosporon cavernicola]|uniref:UDENN domain-containing protein n=1 Tax=Cutaneotrichosporon cavernicola TaxID=279322 RepID=A0AA48I3H0_9TREE|nr:uncharacterized protein CcaverHIS019_0306190 [Cutaneotrichosporon cavernicola]BEI82755.1 hypothetical protein CcaverHIS002_0306230 [Cutaneotrichosporon cavernicola]BEI90549.1 hypothetical protein CcaverHIS019_0306190 [Cutaneotrichosporon cavernicola]BEI98323.1 hypothetical protein CcaverHIS631_0306220 [Cutaneotrichosporon cavernicola]BEJ06099.1 hypothetical protein CcaverHIS641_0306210 [Cutaneotrichosporon cavernicola]